MTTLPERLQDVIVSFRRLAKDHEIKADRPHQDDSTRQWHMGTAEAYDDAADRLEAAQSLQAQEVVKETTINHARDPHCCGCYVIRWNDGDPVAVCGECGVQVALLDRLVSGAPEGEWVLVPREPTDEMVDAAAVAAVQHMTKHKQRLRLGDILRLEYAAHLSAAPSPSAALQAGVGRFVACRCVSERDRELCMTKDECSKVYAYSDTAPKEPTK